MQKELSEKELNRRVAVLKRFKELLKEQRNKFNDYLVVLETQERCINNENIEAMTHHTELEEELIGDIFTIQKVIEPIEKMYKLSLPEKNDDEVVLLKSQLNKLQTQVQTQNKKNRDILQSRMLDINEKLHSLKPVYRFAASSFSTTKDATNSAGIVDISI